MYSLVDFLLIFIFPLLPKWLKIRILREEVSIITR